jgi:tRNA-binding EMAP/Myf-like protein
MMGARRRADGPAARFHVLHRRRHAAKFSRMPTITWDDFTKVELRVGRIIKAEPFPQARKPAYILHVDFGPEIGVKKSSAQITQLYTVEELVG